jgi:hypothetical protein
MKLVTLLTTLAGLTLAGFALGLALDRFVLPLFVLAIAAWFVLLTVHAYLPARPLWQPRSARQATPVTLNRTSTLPLAI